MENLFSKMICLVRDSVSYFKSSLARVPINLGLKLEVSSLLANYPEPVQNEAIYPNLELNYFSTFKRLDMCKNIISINNNKITSLNLIIFFNFIFY